MSDDNGSIAGTEFLSLTADIVAAHVSNNRVAANELPGLIAAVHGALAGLDAAPAEADLPKQEPAVSIRSSIRPDYLVCLEDGNKLKMLKRYLRTNYDMSPDDYRKKWGLPSDYPMVAPSYAEKRRGLAHAIGLGRKAKPPEETPAETGGEPAPKPRRGRPPKAKPPVDAPADAPAPETAEAAPEPAPEPAAEKPARKARKLSGKAALAKARGETADA